MGPRPRGTFLVGGLLAGLVTVGCGAAYETASPMASPPAAELAAAPTAPPLEIVAAAVPLAGDATVIAPLPPLSADTAIDLVVEHAALPPEARLLARSLR